MDPAKWPANGLLNHPIVREVFEGRQGDVDSGIGIASEHPVEEGHGAAIPLVYDADSSQHSALVDVLALKKNMVIEGPPGTGKSQTITNLIAACLADGKKVLRIFPDCAGKMRFAFGEQQKKIVISTEGRNLGVFCTERKSRFLTEPALSPSAAFRVNSI